MKLISFYGVKGGIGKTTFNIIYSSYLHSKGVKVGFIDFEDRGALCRTIEIKSKQKYILNLYEEKLQKLQGKKDQSNRIEEEKQLADQRDLQLQELKKKINNTFTIIPISNKEYLNHKDKYKDKFLKIEEIIKKDEFDVLVLDFGGQEVDMLMYLLIQHNYLQLLINPIDKDIQTIQEAIKLKQHLAYYQSLNLIGFMNRVKPIIRKHHYIRLIQSFIANGLKILPDMIYDSDKILKINELSILRSTLEFPDFNQEEFKTSGDIGLLNLFIDITKELQKLNNIKNTNNTNTALEFINYERKNNTAIDRNRMITNSSFPEYELILDDYERTNFNLRNND